MNAIILVGFWSLTVRVFSSRNYPHVALKKLHWLRLPIKQSIDYKLTYKTLQIQQPTYLYNTLSFPSHSLSPRSSDSSVLSIPYVRTSLGKKAFSVIASRPATCYLFQHSAQNSKQVSLPTVNSLPSYPSDCLPRI